MILWHIGQYLCGRLSWVCCFLSVLSEVSWLQLSEPVILSALVFLALYFVLELDQTEFIWVKRICHLHYRYYFLFKALLCVILRFSILCFSGQSHPAKSRWKDVEKMTLPDVLTTLDLFEKWKVKNRHFQVLIWLQRHLFQGDFSTLIQHNTLKMAPWRCKKKHDWQRLTDGTPDPQLSPGFKRWDHSQSSPVPCFQHCGNSLWNTPASHMLFACCCSHSQAALAIPAPIRPPSWASLWLVGSMLYFHSSDWGLLLALDNVLHTHLSLPFPVLQINAHIWTSCCSQSPVFGSIWDKQWQ